MFVRRKKLLLGLGLLLLVVWMFESEVRLRGLKTEFHPFVPFNTLPDVQELKVQIPGQEGIMSVMSRSAGSATYSSLQFIRDEKEILDFWSTDSIGDSPKIWIETHSSTTLPRVLTYQPLAYPSETPRGTTRFGFYLWSFEDGQYRSKKLAVCPLNLWIRNPFPFQN